MRTLYLIPFLAAPFFLPELSAGVRIVSLIAVYLSALLWLVPSFRNENHAKERLSPFHWVILIGVLLLFFSINDPWHRHCAWPVSVVGVFLLITTSRGPIPAILGLALTGIGLWIMAFTFSVTPNLYPMQTYSELVSIAFPPSSLTLDSGIVLPTAIRIPDIHTQMLMFQMAAAITMTLLVALGFSKILRRVRLILWLPLICWCVLVFPIMGRDLFLLLALLIAIFLLINGYPRTIFSGKTFFSITLFLVFCALGYQGYLDRTAVYTSQLYDSLGTQIPHIPSIRMIGTIPIDTLFFAESKMGSDWVIPLSVGLGLLLLIAETGFFRKKEDLRYPVGVSLLFLTGISIGHSLHAWLVHPLTWISMACLQNAERRENPTQKESSLNLPITHWMSWSLIGFMGLLGIMAIGNLYPNWQVDKALYRLDRALAQGERPDELTPALKRAPYRGDLAALYATEKIMTLYPQGILPPSPEPDKLESFMNIAAKHGFISLLGYARLSNLYFLHSEGENSISVLSDAVLKSPGEVTLHELLADTLETLGRKEQALDHYRICANINPSSARIREKMARIYLSQGKADEAKQEINNLLTLDPTKKLKKTQ